MRSNGCGDLREQNIDQQVQLCGWVDRRRDHGGVIFIDLRDREGVTQVRFDATVAPEAYALAQTMRNEYVVGVRGTVESRGAKLTSLHGDACWQHVHPDEGNVMDLTLWTQSHPGNANAAKAGRPNPITTFARCGLSN